MQFVCSLANLAHAGQEYEDAAVRRFDQFASCSGCGRREVAALADAGCGCGLRPANLDGVAPPLALDDRTAAEVRRDGLRFERGRHDHDEQLGPNRLPDESDHAEGQVCLQPALVELVEDDARDTFEEGVIADHAQADAGRDDEDARARGGFTVEANLIAEGFAERGAVFVGHASCRRACGDAAGFEHEYQPIPEPLVADDRRRHACGFASPGRRAEHDRTGVPQRGQQLGDNSVDG